MAKYSSFKYGSTVYGKTVAPGAANIISYNVVNKRTAKFTGKALMAISGTVTRIISLFRNVGIGILSISGTTKKSVKKSFIRNISMLVSLAKLSSFKRISTGTINISGDMSIIKALLYYVGNGLISGTVTVFRNTKKNIIANIPIAKSFTRQISLKRTFTDVISASGHASKRMWYSVSRAITMASSIKKETEKWFKATISSTGNRTNMLLKSVGNGKSLLLETFSRIASHKRSAGSRYVETQGHMLRIGSLKRAISGSVNIVSTFSRVGGFARSIFVSLPISKEFKRRASLKRSISDYVKIDAHASKGMFVDISKTISSIASTVNKHFTMSFEATVALVGALSKLIPKVITSTVSTISSMLITSILYFRTVGMGLIAPNSIIEKAFTYGRIVGNGILSVSGHIVRAISKFVGFSPIFTYGSFKYGEKKYTKRNWIIGGVNKQTTETFSSVMDIAGGTVFMLFRNIFSNVSIIASFARLSSFKRIFTGKVNISGEMSTVKALLRYVGGGLVSATTTVLRNTKKNIESNIPIIKSFIRQASLKKAFAGIVSVNGHATKKMWNSISRAVSMSSSIAKKTEKWFQATINSTGNRINMLLKSVGNGSSLLLESFSRIVSHKRSTGNRHIGTEGHMSRIVSLRRILSGKVNIVGVFSRIGMFTRSTFASLPISKIFKRQASLKRSISDYVKIDAHASKGMFVDISKTISSIASTVNKHFTMSFDASVALIGTLSKLISKAITSTVSTISSTLITSILFFRTVGMGLIAPNSIIEKAFTYGRIVGNGILSVSGHIVRAISKFVGFSPIFTYGSFKYGEKKYTKRNWIIGDVNKQTTKTFSSVMDIAGGTVFMLFRNIFSAVSSSALIVKNTLKQKIAHVSSESIIVRKTGKVILATTDISGMVSRFTKKTAEATIHIYGGMEKIFVKIITASVHISGNISKLISKTLKAVVNIFKRLTRFWTVHPQLSYTEYPINLEYSEHLVGLSSVNYYMAFEVEESYVESACYNYIIDMEVVGVPLAGSTITLKGIFPDSAGNLAELEDVTVKVYAPNKVLLETIAATEIDVGVYTANYTIPEDKFGNFDYEFSGILGDKTIVGRSSFDSKWK